jgi:hypothetical protein
MLIYKPREIITRSDNVTNIPREIIIEVLTVNSVKALCDNAKMQRTVINIL